MNNNRILIVDDNEAIHDDFRKILGKDQAKMDFDAEEEAFFGADPVAVERPVFTMDFAVQGRDALALVEASREAGRPYAMVFMDVRMPPGWDGIETTARMWAIDPDLQVVLCTAYSDHSWDRMIARLGNSDRLLILKKPFDTSEVFQLAHALTTKWNLQREARRHSDFLKAAVKLRTLELEQEVAERKRNVEALKVTQFSVDHASDAMFWVAPDSRFIYVNAVTSESLGYDAETLLKMRIEEVIPKFLDIDWNEFWATLRVERHRTFDAEGLARDGRRIPIELTVNWFNLAGREFMCASARDITRRCEILAELSDARDMALESVRLKGQFLANMSHEIRTPMNGVVGMAELLLHTNLNREQREHTDVIRSCANHLLEIINSILDYSKIESRQLQLEDRDFDLGKLIDETLNMVSSLARKKGLELAGCVNADVPRSLRGDSGRLKQVLTNLIGNAVKFTEHGEVALNVSLVGGAVVGHLLRFEVCDTGTGIDEASLQRIFEPFHQADGSDTRRHGGTGLGLTICRQIVEAMDGQLDVESKLGIGSCFSFTLAMKAAAGSAFAAATGIVRPSVRRALVVDGNASHRQVLQSQLTQLMVMSDAAPGATEALEMLRAGAAAGEPYGLVLVDYQMSGMDGLVLAKAIKADQSLAAARIIILSSLNDHISPASFEAAGVDDSLVKPVRSALLEHCVYKAFGSLPAESPTASAPQTRSASPRSATRVLLAEDNSVNQKLALLQLQQLGYSADLAANGAEVLTALETETYDIILMDCQMPVMDGYTASREIRRKYPELSTNIIAMTANAMAADREKCLQAEMNDHLVKPVTLEDLARVLTKWAPTPAAPASALESSQPAVDVSRLLEVTGENPELFRQVVREYLSQADEIIALMLLALDKGDFGGLHRLSHKLGGSSASCGMIAIVPALAKLERMGGGLQPVFAKELLGEATEQLGHIRRFLHDYIKLQRS